MTDSPPPPLGPSPQPVAPLGRRVVAGVIDAAALFALCLGLFLFPLLTRGLVLPMWGVLAAVVGYSVVPLSAFRQTLGMKLVGVELVTKDGHAVSPGDVLFRELIGRGYFPLAFLATVFLGLLASWLHLMAFVAPTGTTLFFAFACLGGVAFALLGHALVLNRPDHRGLADLMSRSFVRPVQPRPPADDEEERQHQRREGRSRLVKVFLFEVVLFGGALALPWVLTQRTESREAYANRLKRERLETQLKLHPDDEGVASELVMLSRQAGQFERAAEVEKQLEAIHAKKRAEREASLRQRLKDAPQDEEAIGRLLDLLEEDGREDDAVKAYRDFLAGDDVPELRAGFARWLMVRERYDEAQAELEQAVKAAGRLEGAHALKGELWQRKGDRAQALDELYLATLEDPDDDDSKALLEQLEQEAPLSPARKKQLEKQFQAEQKAP